MPPEGIDRLLNTSRGVFPCREWGAGSPVLCLHGTLMDRRMFEPQGQDLGDRYRLIAVDSRARSEDLWQGPYTFDDLVADYLAVADGLGIERFAIYGMSLGGMVAPFIALAAPDRVTAIIFQNAVTEHHPSPNEVMWEQLREQEFMGGLAYGLADQVFGPSVRHDHPALVREWADRWAQERAEKVYWEVQSTFARPDVESRLKELECPCLVIHAEHEPFWSLEHAERLTDRLKDAELIVVEDVGHTAQIERPDVVNAVVRRFLDGVPSWAVQVG